MRLFLVLQHLLVFVSVLPLFRAQTTTETTTTTSEPSTILMDSTTTKMTMESTAETTTQLNTATTELISTTAWTAPEIFYPFGTAVGDTETIETGSETYQYVSFSTPFSFFGRSHSNIYINNNGLLTFYQPVQEAHPYQFPIYGYEDYIAPLWTELDDFGIGKYWYQEYTSGSVLTRATEDINQYFPNTTFTATRVFVVTWDYVATLDMNEYNLHSQPAITFQAVLISDGGVSFILMNYGDCSTIVYPVEAGYDTVSSTDYHVIHYYTDGSYIPTLKNTTNVNVPGRWAFLVNNGTEITTTTTLPTTSAIEPTTAWAAPEIFYPFGTAVGDTEHLEVASDSYQDVSFSTPFFFFGRNYSHVYVNNNGLLTFNLPLPESHPVQFPYYGAEDYIATLWTELDDIGLGRYWYQEHTSGSVLTRATQDINQYFPDLGFTASRVFVVTWDYSFTWDLNAYYLHTGPAITFQAVLISGGGFSFVLMNYGDCAGIYFPVEAGFDTIQSTNYYVIHYDWPTGYSIPTLKSTTNVNVPGRWAFLVNNGTENLIGVQMKVRSFLDLTESNNIEEVLQLIKQELVNRNVPSHFKLKLRKVQKTQP